LEFGGFFDSVFAETLDIFIEEKPFLGFRTRFLSHSKTNGSLTLNCANILSLKKRRACLNLIEKKRSNRIRIGNLPRKMSKIFHPVYGYQGIKLCRKVP